MKKSLFIKLSLPILFFFVILSSCMTTNTKTTPNNQNTLSTNQNKNTFKTKSLPTKPNEDFRIQVLEKSEDVPITITNKFKRPLVSTISHNYFDFSPQIRTKKFHKAFTAQEIKQKRREARSKWREWHKARKKKLKQELKEQHKNQRLYQREVISMMLSLEEKNSPEYKALLKEQIDLRKELLQGQKNERKELKEQYKLEIEEFKNALNENYPKENNKLYIPKDIEPCDIENTTCNVFDYIAFPNDPNPDKDYEYVEENDPTAYTYDNTYVDGKPYTDTYTNSNGELYKPKLVSNDAFKTSSLKLFSVKSNNKKSFNVKNTTNCTPVEISNEIDGDSVILNIKMNNPTNSCDTLGTFELKITKNDSIQEACSNFNDISISTNKMMSFKVKIPLSFVSHGSDMYISFKNASGEYISSNYSYVYNPVGGVKINYVKRDLSVDPSESSSGYKNVYEIENSTNDYLNFTLENSAGEFKMSGLCLGMSKGLISIDKSQLRTDDYVLKIYRASSNSSDPVAQQIVPITNIKVASFFLTSKNIEDFYFYDKDKNQHNNSYFSFNFYNNNNKNYIRSVNVPNALLNLEHFESSEYTDNTCFTTNYLDSIFTSPLSSQVVSMDSMQNLNSYIKSSIGKNIIFNNCSNKKIFIGLIYDLSPDTSADQEKLLNNYKNNSNLDISVNVLLIDKNTNKVLAYSNDHPIKFSKNIMIYDLDAFISEYTKFNLIVNNRDFLSNRDLIVKVEPNFKSYGLDYKGMPIFEFGLSNQFPFIGGYKKFDYENLPYISNEVIARAFTNNCGTSQPNNTNIPLPQGVKNEYDLSFDKNTFSNYETEINRYLTSIGRSTNHTYSFNYSFHDQLNQIIKNLDNEFNTYNNDNDLNDEMSLLSKEIYLYKELVKTQIDDKSISKNYDSNYINIIRILNGNILKHLDYYNQYYHLIRPISQEELDLIHLTADVFLKELEIEEGFNVKAGSSVAYKQDLIEFKYIDQNTLRKKTSPNYSKDKSRFGITLRIILKIYNDIHYGTDRDNISRNMETNLKVYKEILDMLQTFPCTKNLTTTRIGQIISKLKTEWDSTDKIVSSYVEDRNKTNYNTSAILNSVNALTSTLNNNKTSIKKECDSDTNGCNEAHIVVGTHSQYMTSRELFNSCLIIKEYIGPERIGKFIDVGTLYTKPMAIGGAISSEISDYKGLSSDKKKQLVYEFETEPKISRISENELKQKLFKKRGAGYVKLKNGNCRKSELHWYEIEAGYSETNIFNPTKVLRNFYYYQTHVATKNEGVKIDGWMGNEISCEGVK